MRAFPSPTVPLLTSGLLVLVLFADDFSTGLRVLCQWSRPPTRLPMLRRNTLTPVSTFTVPRSTSAPLASHATGTNFNFGRPSPVRSSWSDLTEMEFFVRRVMKIQGGPIRPLAFPPDHEYLCIIFEAGGNYYSLDTSNDCWEHFEGDFASDDEFLAALVGASGIRRLKWSFPDNTDDLYTAAWEEQERKAAEVAGS
ncbi:hypothetical protein C8R45DRAFT_928754 [Mycena sanguinolenta]|nr:hypothetical protein C8R45DRAFT_928754 [Mycena sanguinolenta]